MNRNVTIEEVLRCAGRTEYDLDERVEEMIPKYIWTMGAGKKKTGWCSACKQLVELGDYKIPDWVVNDPYVDSNAFENPEFVYPTSMCRDREKIKGTTRHLDYGNCPVCGKTVQFRSLAKGRRNFVDRLFFIRYSKSLADDRALCMKGFEVNVYWNEIDEYGTMEPPIEIIPLEVCLFVPGRPGERFTRPHFWIADIVIDDRVVTYRRSVGGWEHKRECKSGYNPVHSNFGNGGMPVVLDQASFEEAIKGTPVKAVMEMLPLERVESFEMVDLITFVERIMRYPCVEYLTKLGQSRLAVDVIDGVTKGVINLRGKTACKVLGLSGDQWGEIKGKGLELCIDSLRVMRLAKAYNLRINMELICWVGNSNMGPFFIRSLLDMKGQADVVKSVKYCRKKRVNLSDYLDYLDQMIELKMDMRDKFMLYPKDFNQMHERLTQRIGYKRNIQADMAIQEKMDKLGVYWFSALGLVLRPMASSHEIVQEGNIQHICVGSYVERYARGDDVLCVLREESALNKPFYTVEFAKDGRLVQCRGFKNQTRPEDRERLEAFWRLFDFMRNDYKEDKKTKK